MCSSDLYGIVTPIVSGTSSDEWGTAEQQTFVENYDIKAITAQYTGLSGTAGYQLLATLFSGDSGITTTQRIVGANGDVILPTTILPYNRPTSYSTAIPKNSIDASNLQLNVSASSGPRAILQGLMLVKQRVVDSTAPVITISSPDNGDLVSATDLLIQGTAIDDASGIHSITIGIQRGSDAIRWSPVSSLTTAGIWTYRWNHSITDSYTIYVHAVDRAGNSPVVPTQINVSIDADAPAAVSNVNAQEAENGIRVTWVPSADDDAAEIGRAHV